MRTDTPVQTKIDDYTPYPFAIENVDMAFDLEPAATRVHTRLNITRLAPGDMVLDGIALTLNTVSIDGTALPESTYTKTDESLTLHNVPDAFTLDIDVTIDPSANTVLSGLYMSGGRFCTQCESVGFRRITYWPDRPDVMSRFQVPKAGRTQPAVIFRAN